MCNDYETMLAEEGLITDDQDYCACCHKVKDISEFADPNLCQDCYESWLQKEEVALEDADNYPDGIDGGG